MATLYITEFSEVGRTWSGDLEAARVPPIASQTVAIGGTSVQSSAFNAATRFVRLHTDVICSVAFGTNPTATAASMRMAAGQTEYFGVVAGAGIEVAVITNT